MSDRIDATPYGGVGLALRMAERSGLMDAIEEKVRVLKQRQPYSEADHVMNMNALCGGTCLEDIKHRKHDAAFLEMLGTLGIPDSTTAGDFCRRFNASDVEALQDAINEARLHVWRAQGDAFVAKTAILDVDGTLVETTGECKEGADLTYKKLRGYHPLLVTYANTQEPLFIVNRPGTRPSVEGAPALLDKAIQLCRDAGHTKIRMRGDTAFSMTRYLDRWHEDG
ncbi:MAG: transposase, partial [Myxococcota bacterium]